MSEPLHIISLGAGVQSSTIALMAAKGALGPMPTMAIFADTQDEPESVYKWLAWLENQLPFPIIRVSIGKLSLAALTLRVSKRGAGYLKPALPTYLSGGGMMQRHCTMDFKITPILRYLRLVKGTASVKEWLGISTDEALRQTESQEAWAEHLYPLIDAKMSREDCQTWIMDEYKKTAPRSACKYCPFHSDEEWLRQKEEEPKEFAASVQFERDLQAVTAQTALIKTPYLHDSRLPLDIINFGAMVAERKYKATAQGELFINECKGRCGV